MSTLNISKAGTVFMMVLFLAFPLLAYEGALNKDTISEVTLKEYSVTHNSGPTLRFDKKEVFSPNGTYTVSVNKKGEWIQVAEIQADKHLRKASVDLTRWVKNGEILLRIEQKGGGAAHIDYVNVNGLIPSNLDGYLTKKLSKRDNDIIEAFGKTFELAFENIQTNRRNPALLELFSRIEPEIIGQTPFHFPLENMYEEMSSESEFYTYEIGSQNGKLTVDGELSTESLGEPFFVEFFPSGSGHPDAKTFGWVKNDGENLYVAIDLLGDNTMDGGKDYTKVYINTPEGVREFKVTEEQMHWGKPGFTYTERAGWQHKVYEFVIPLSEIQSILNNDQPLQLAFAAYGTGMPPALRHDPPSDPNGVNPDSGPSGTTFTFSVTYSDPTNDTDPNLSQVWIDLDGDGVMDTAKSPFFLMSPTNLTNALLLLIPAALLLLSLCLCKSLRFIKHGIVLAALIALTAILLTGCPEPPPANTTQEVYDMTWVNIDASVDWVAGEDFSADVQIYAPSGDYTFKFIFKDMYNNDVSGPAAGDLTLTIQ